ncbi:transglycosylase domain-containing protein [Lacticaseibacillus nasuensis]|uniref:Membrane carboxypeptidase n=1 Tax=Lacticaseibacillus nasuensis JCM 17158 TaxID=1291734 RepID=A0A0R1JGJ3_9LACO|nr:transglycosylase domain-containing protein [Lacticaseibacillus nasuensis]KRK70318.1 membrane carboxypeptidase [Lacticaseibacillus nasuensis JCM 17158]
MNTGHKKRRSHAWLARLNHKLTQRSPEALPPLSGKTWRLYADITLQVVKSLAYYVIATIGIGLVFGVGMLGGYFAAIVDHTPVPTQQKMTQTLGDVDSTTTLYYANNVMLGNIKSDLMRDKVPLADISPYLKQAIVATEDEDFYHHDGVVPKSVLRAVISALTGVGSQTGGSTLTQQVVKLQFLSSETTFKRKVVEIMYALRLNHFFSKDQILEAYLNIATLGRNNKGQNIAGVQTAAEGIFGKSAKQLNLAEAAYIAGLPQSPSVYTPYTITGALKADDQVALGIGRQKTVLFRMYRAGMITNKQYQAAKKFDIKKDFLPQSTAKDTTTGNYVYTMVQGEAETVLAQKLAKDDGHSQAAIQKNTSLANQYLEQAKTMLSTKGYKVHSTINKPIYDTMQQVAKANAGSLGYTYRTTQIDAKTGRRTTISEPVQNGSLLLDNNSGAVIGFIGGVSGQLNHVYTTRSPGSSIKPLLVYGPAVENKLIGSQTMLADFANDFGNYRVTDYGTTLQNKFVPATTALAQSYNVPAVELYNALRKKTNPKTYMEKMGLTTLTDHDYSQLGIALGGTDYGLTVEDEAAAYATFWRGGTYVAPYVIDKIVDPMGNVVYQHKAAPTTVFSKATAYIMQQMMHEVVNTGTATQLKNQLSFSTNTLIGKTGTSNDFKDIWFSGSTPGMTLTSWIGYDNNNGSAHLLSESASSLNMTFWAKVANAVYRKIPNQFALTKTMAKPSTVKTVKVNAKTGEKIGTVLANNRTYHVGNETLTSLYNDWEPGASKAKFGIGGSADNYALFWYNFGGVRNGYGRVTTGVNSTPKSTTIISNPKTTKRTTKPAASTSSRKASSSSKKATSSKASSKASSARR